MLAVGNLYKTFFTGRGASSDRVVAVDDVSFEVPEGKLFTLLGPSGCGKSTTLRCIAGLETPDSGEIRLRDRTFFSSRDGTRMRANDRHLGMVFQSYAIWPHMNVFENVAFPLVVQPRGRRPSKKEIRRLVENTLAVVRLDHLSGRRATDLSGGQQQRLALARALVTEPPLLLLDEPLSNLDAKLREEMRLELKRLQRELGVTAVYVTHDQVEALALSNLIAVMNDGVIQQTGEPRDIYDRPASRFVADFIGTSNFIEGVIERKEPGGVYVVTTAEGTLRAMSSIDFASNTAVVVSIRPEHVRLQERDLEPTGPNRWPGHVVMRGFLGESVDHLVRVGTLGIRVRTNPKLSISRDTDVTLVLPEDDCSLIPRGD
jgi:iron(III) transport system ATP-binding protein